jgi:hypothetical protein
VRRGLGSSVSGLALKGKPAPFQKNLKPETRN